MKSLDFLHVADKLKDSSQEAERRTSVSRAYYSVFHYIKNYLTANEIYVRYPGHEPLIQYIKNSGIEKARNLSQMMTDLKGERRKADYKLDLAKFNKKTCIFIFLKAKKAIQEFQNIKGKALIDGINNYKRKIGEA